jgi:uncharacterized membrane protein
MNKQQYLGILRQELTNLGPAAVNEIIRDFEEHYANGLANGKSEDEITSDLGSPTEIARQYLEGSYEGPPAREEAKTAGPQAAGQTARMAEPVSRTGTEVKSAQPAKAKINETALVLVIILNILIGIPLWISLFATLFGCWVAAGGLGVAALVLFVLAIVQTGVAGLILALFGLSLTALAVLAIILMVYLSKWLVSGLIYYIRWNGKLVTGGQTA